LSLVFLKKKAFFSQKSIVLFNCGVTYKFQLKYYFQEFQFSVTLIHYDVDNIADYGVPSH